MSGEKANFHRHAGKTIRLVVPNNVSDSPFAKRLKSTGDALGLWNSMNRSRKHPIGKKGTRKKNTRNRLVPWLWLAMTMAALLLLALWLRDSRNTMSGRSGAESGAHPSIVGRTEDPVGPAKSKSDVALPVSHAEPVDIDKAADHVNLGTLLLDQGKITEAVEQYRQAVKLDPGDEDAHYNLALALVRQGNRREAKEQYLEALRILPDYAEAHNNLGNLLVAEENLEEGIVHFRAALKNSPDYASAHNNLGTALARQGKVMEAIACFREALRLKPEYLEAGYNLGSACLSQNRIGEAIFQFTNILQQHPDFAPAQRGLIKAREMQNETPAFPPPDEIRKVE